MSGPPSGSASEQINRSVDFEWEGECGFVLVCRVFIWSKCTQISNKTLQTNTKPHTNKKTLPPLPLRLRVALKMWDDGCRQLLICQDNVLLSKGSIDEFRHVDIEGDTLTICLSLVFIVKIVSPDQHLTDFDDWSEESMYYEINKYLQYDISMNASGRRMYGYAILIWACPHEQEPDSVGLLQFPGRQIGSACITQGLASLLCYPWRTASCQWCPRGYTLKPGWSCQ